MALTVIILAAGQGTRMKSSLPKVLHPVAGHSMLEHVVRTAEKLGPREIRVVYGHGGERVPEALKHLEVSWWRQDQQLGTGHAVEQAMPGVHDEDVVLVLYGDVPLIRAETLIQLVEQAQTVPVSLLTVTLEDPAGYGRIVRDDQGRVLRITEEKDASADDRAIREVNTGILAVQGSQLKHWLARLDNQNAQGEFYLTDVIAMAVGEGREVKTVTASDAMDVAGVNNRLQLAQVERAYQRRQAERLMLAGVSLADPERIDVRGTLITGTDVGIDVNCVFHGEVEIGSHVSIGPGCVIANARIEAGAVIRAHTVIEDAVIGAGAVVGPFARLRPGAELAEHVHIGNFVEVKKSRIGEGSKVNHLSYVGDARVGSGVNIGAGTITCNYDGANKHETVIEDDVFVGSATQFVAPVRIGKGSTIGAGSTITRDVEADVLALSRAKQKRITGWQRPRKKPDAS